MNYSPQALQTVATLINKQLSADSLPMPLAASPQQTIDYEALLAWLTPRIQYLLDHAFEKLLQLMYRIDIAETHFQQALGHPNPDEIASSIARLVIERQLYKVKIREKYSTNH